MPRRIWRSTAAIGRRRAVAGHRAGVTEAEVDVVVAVDAAEMGARRALDVWREWACPLDHPRHRDALEERAPGTLVECRGPWMGVGEGGHLVGHEAGETVAIEGGAVDHAIRMAGRDRRCAVIPRDGSVDAADEPADVAGRGARLGVEIEQACAAIGAAEEAAVGGRERAATHAPNGRGASGHGRCCGTGHHGDRLLLSARPDRGMSDRLRLVLMCLRVGPGAWFGRSNRVVASDGYSGSIGHPFDFVKYPMVPVVGSPPLSSQSSRSGIRCASSGG